MTPDYLLHLDFQTIRLFLRDEDGSWRMVGRAAPDDHGLDETMQAMIGRAQAAKPGPVEAVIALPFDLVFVTKVETDPDLGWVRRDMEIRNALDQAISDPIEELSFDTETDGTMTTAVVVHNQTIAEAAAFAEAHGIAPLAFIAMPRDGDGFHRPALFQQTPLGAERAGEDGVLEIAVPGSAALRSKSIVRESWRRTIEPRKDTSGDTDEVVDLTEDIPDFDQNEQTQDLAEDLTDAHTQSGWQPSPPASEPAEPDPPKPAPELMAPETPAPTSLPIPDPFEKLARPFAERPYEPWTAKAMRYSAPLAAVLAVFAVVSGVAYFVLPPSDEAPEIAVLPEIQESAIATESPGSGDSAVAPPRDPITDPVAANAPDQVIAPAAPVPDEAEPETTEPEGLVQPEDPTESPRLVPLDIASPATSELPRPALPVEGASVGRDQASRDSAEPATVASLLGNASLTERLNTAIRPAPAPLYDLLTPRIAADIIEEINGLRPIERPEDLYPDPAEADVAERPEFNGVSDIRPVARPGTAQAPETQESGDPAADQPSDEASLNAPDIPQALAVLASIRPITRPGSDIAGATGASLIDTSSDDAQPIILPPTLAALGTVRPAGRPESLADAPTSTTTAEPVRLVASFTALRPAPRPSNLRRPATTRQPAVTPAPTPVTARATAPQSEALRGGDLILLGTTGTSSRRRALVQIPGRGITTVSVGDSLNGGRVAAIDIATLVYTRGGRTIRLDMPR